MISPVDAAERVDRGDPVAPGEKLIIAFASCAKLVPNREPSVRTALKGRILNAATAEGLSVAALAGVLVFAVARPKRWPEACVAIPAAGVLVAVGAVSPSQAWAQIRSLFPVVAFLAIVLVLAQLCADEGLFAAAGDAVARACRAKSRRLLGGVFVAASVITAVLSLDATVVLLTPVVLATASRLGARPRPHVYACAHLANTASVLLPVSNLTNLLAFAAAGIAFPRFAVLMGPPWLAGIAIEYLVFRRFFRADLAAPLSPIAPSGRPDVPLFTVVILAMTLAGFAVGSVFGLSPVWVALAGTAVLAVRALRQRKTTVVGLARSASALFCLFVLALGVVVQAVVENGLGHRLDTLLPAGAGLAALLAVAGAAAVLANLINNLPAILALLPILGPHGAGPVLAGLIGVNVGPNLTYVGSLATLLWRRILHDHDQGPELGEFTRLGLLTVPATLLTATVALWAMLRLTGG